MSQLFGENLRAYRILARMTQLDLARATGVTRSAVNNYEAGKSEPNFAVLCKFADVLGVDITELVSKNNRLPDYIRKVQVTERENYLLDVFRGADPTYQSVAIDILRLHQKEGR